MHLSFESTWVLVATLFLLPATLGSEKILDCSCSSGQKQDSRITLRCVKDDAVVNEVDPSLSFMTDVLLNNSDKNAACHGDVKGFLPQGYLLMPQLGFYKVYRTSRNHSEAQAACARDGGHLAVAATPEEMGGLAWVARDVDQAWVANEGPEANCSVILSNFASLEQQPCSSAQPFLCRLSGQPPAFGLALGRDGRLLRIHRRALDRDSAARLCASEGSSLVVLRSEAQAEEMLRLMDNAYDGMVVFVGLRRAHQADSYFTDAGEPEKLLEFRNWVTVGKTKKSQNCAAYTHDGYLTPVSCDKRLPFYCEKNISDRH